MAVATALDGKSGRLGAGSGAPEVGSAQHGEVRTCNHWLAMEAKVLAGVAAATL